MLESIQHKKSRKTALELKNKNDLSRVTEILKNLKVDFDIVEI